jgi:type IV secretory pathway VirB10-like protein
MFSNRPPDAPATAGQDRAGRPTGVLPRHLQTWVVLGIAVSMTGIIALSGSSRPVDRRPAVAGSLQPLEANDARIQEYRKRIDEEARRLSAAQAELDLAKRGLGTPAAAMPEPVVQQQIANGSSPEAGIENERRQRAYRALFADNIALSFRKAMPSAGHDEPAAPPAATSSGAARAALALAPSGTTYPVTEGTVIEAVLTNRLDGAFAGPVNAMVTANVYAADRQHLLIPQGARLLGEAKAVDSFGQQRLAVAFHRLLLPDGKSVTLDQFKGLSQMGATGLEDQVNHHYAQLFGVSIAIGVIGGLAQVNTHAGLDATPADLYRQGVGASLSQSALHILDRFLNVLPTVTIREGQRLKVYLSADLALPAIGEHHD